MTPVFPANSSFLIWAGAPTAKFWFVAHGLCAENVVSPVEKYLGTRTQDEKSTGTIEFSSEENLP
jgi:hypothetical protein